MSEGSSEMGTEFSSQSDYSILTMVEENMPVIDRDGDEVGHVGWVQFGEVSSTEAEMGLGPATTSGMEEETRLPGENTWVEELDRGLTDDEGVTESLEGRLMRHGYVKVKSKGLFSGDRFVLPEHIASVHDGQVHLNISKDEMIEQR
jgi:hypothetical protein